MSKDIELLPCPFCGGKSEITKHFKDDVYSLVHRCQIIGPIVFDFSSHGRIVKTWNTRAVLAAPQQDRFFLDHGLWHDRVTGQHMYTQDQYDEESRACLAEGKLNALAALEMLPVLLSDEDIKKESQKHWHRAAYLSGSDGYKFDELAFARALLAMVQTPDAGIPPPPAAPVLSDEDLLSHFSRYWEHQWHDGSVQQIRISESQLLDAARALLAKVTP